MMLPKLRVLTFILMMIFLYIIPVVFAGWLNGDSDLIFTTLIARELYPLDYFVTVFEHQGNTALFIPFRLTYLGCLTFNAALVSLIVDVFKIK
jgi:hypothetical protein